MAKNVVLTCTSIWYCSRLDEDMFFEWISKIPGILKWDGERENLYLYVKSRRLSNANLRDFLALFYRYKVDMKQLSIFLNSSNKKWFFDNKKAYWHRSVFGVTKPHAK